jgi:glyoxylase-like metal-dependent hydrolase (beta-lactamase superfamily II)
LELTFPNATYHVQSEHWDWARASNPREKASFLDENLEPLAQSGQLNQLDGAGEIVPGVDPIVVNGHTRAQQAIRVSDGEATLVFVADLIPTSAHIPAVWGMAYDIEPMKTIDEKVSFLDSAAAHGWSIFFEHDPEIEVMDVEQNDGRIRGTNARPLAEF